MRDPEQLDLPARFRFSLPLTFRTEQTSRVISELIPGIEYRFTLRAFGQQGQESNEESRVIGVTCKKPFEFLEIFVVLVAEYFIKKMLRRTSPNHKILPQTLKPH